MVAEVEVQDPMDLMDRMAAEVEDLEDPLDCDAVVSSRSSMV